MSLTPLQPPIHRGNPAGNPSHKKTSLVLERDLQPLDPDQIDAVQAKPGPVLVLAGAGAGKTRVLTERAAHIIKSGARPETLLLITFTREAAHALENRIRDRLPSTCASLQSGTFHQIGYKILRRHARLVGFSMNFRLSSGTTRVADMNGARKEAGLPESSGLHAESTSTLLHLWDQFRTSNGSSFRDWILARRPELSNRDIIDWNWIYTLYEKLKQKQNRIDYEDLLVKPVSLLRRFPALQKLWSGRFSHLLVDEYQDVNPIQIELLRLLAPHNQIFAVGDVAQAIYSFRGAMPEHFYDFPRTFGGARVIRLGRNYRNRPEIIDLANQIPVRKNAPPIFQLSMQSTREVSGLKPVFHSFATAEKEASWVAESILQRIRTGTPPDDLAILCRTHQQMRDIKSELHRFEIPFASCPTRPPRLTVRVTTIHRAKGLEFKVVYLPGLIEGNLPNHHAVEAEDAAEERRLFYVAVTRAREELILTAYKRSKGSESPGPSCQPSRFVNELSPEVYNRPSEQPL